MLICRAMFALHRRNPEPEDVLIQESSEIVLTLILNGHMERAMDDVHAINMAKSHSRDGFSNSDVEEVLSGVATARWLNRAPRQSPIVA